MTIVDVADFHPRTGAYWQGWDDALREKPCEWPERYEEESIANYKAGYADALEGGD